MKRTMLILAMLVAMGAMGVAANAMTTEGVLDLSLVIKSPTEFQIFASMGDHLGDRGSYGISALQFGVSGWNTLVNEMPFADKKVGKTTYGLGFTVFYSADGETPVTGSLDTTTTGTPIVYGIGQIPIDLFADHGATAGGWNESFGAPVLVASGTYGSLGGPSSIAEIVNPKIDWGEANYFTNNSGTDATAAYVNIQNPTVPEPSSIIALLSGLASVGGLAIRRKKA
jgi:hypothetical protein